MTRIIITKRSIDNYVARIEDHLYQWEYGKTIDEAIEKLLISFPNLRDIEVIYEYRNCP